MKTIWNNPLFHFSFALHSQNKWLCPTDAFAFIEMSKFLRDEAPTLLVRCIRDISFADSNESIVLPKYYDTVTRKLYHRLWLILFCLVHSNWSTARSARRWRRRRRRWRNQRWRTGRFDKSAFRTAEFRQVFFPNLSKMVNTILCVRFSITPSELRHRKRMENREKLEAQVRDMKRRQQANEQWTQLKRSLYKPLFIAGTVILGGGLIAYLYFKD